MPEARNKTRVGGTVCPGRPSTLSHSAYELRKLVDVQSHATAERLYGFVSSCPFHGERLGGEHDRHETLPSHPQERRMVAGVAPESCSSSDSQAKANASIGADASGESSLNPQRRDSRAQYYSPRFPRTIRLIAMNHSGGSGFTGRTACLKCDGYILPGVTGADRICRVDAHNREHPSRKGEAAALAQNCETA